MNNRRNGHNLATAGELAHTKLNAAEMNRRATAILRAKGLIRPFRRTAISTRKEFQP